jgi:hypothetical protein
MEFAGLSAGTGLLQLLQSFCLQDRQLYASQYKAVMCYSAGALLHLK